MLTYCHHASDTAFMSSINRPVKQRLQVGK